MEGAQERLRRNRPTLAFVLRAGRRDPANEVDRDAAHIDDVSKRYGFSIGNVFHAGDGNLHPLILFDQRDREQMRRVVVAAREIIEFCVEVGGTLTGEHGVGMEKSELMPLMFSEADLELMRGVRAVFNPTGLLNPDKILPLGKGCGELRVQPLAGAPGPGSYPSA